VQYRRCVGCCYDLVKASVERIVKGLAASRKTAPASTSSVDSSNAAEMPSLIICCGTGVDQRSALRLTGPRLRRRHHLAVVEQDSSGVPPGLSAGGGSFSRERYAVTSRHQSAELRRRSSVIINADACGSCLHVDSG
jgi:hypothetical protein